MFPDNTVYVADTEIAYVPRVRHLFTRSKNMYSYRMFDGPRRSNMRERSKKLPTIERQRDRDDCYTY